METLDLLRLSNRKLSSRFHGKFVGSNASGVSSEKSAVSYMIKAKIEESARMRVTHDDFEPNYAPLENNLQPLTSIGERSSEVPLWFTKRSDRSYVTRRLDE